MLELYWGCLIFGVIFTVITVIFGDVIGGIFDGLLDWLSFDGFEFLQPLTIVGGITTFGGMGVLLMEYTSLEALFIMIFALLITFIFTFVLYFLYIKSMARAENSTGYSVTEHVGKIGEVIISIPSEGYGEVMLKVGAANTNEIARSFDGHMIRAGEKVIVIEVHEGILYVIRYDDLNDFS